MSIFVDTRLFVAFHITKNVNHIRALEIMKNIVTGKLGSAYTSDYVFDEAITTAFVRTRKPEKALTLGRMIKGEFTTPFLVILRVNATAFKEAWKLFSRYSEREPTFTDCTSVALIRMKDNESIVSLNADFDGIVPRIS